MPISKYDTFIEMKNDHSVDDTSYTTKKQDKIIKELDQMRKILIKSKRKPSEKEMIN